MSEARCYELHPGCRLAELGVCEGPVCEDQVCEDQVCEECRVYGAAVGEPPVAAPAALLGRLRAVARPGRTRPSDDELDRVAASALAGADGGQGEAFEDAALQGARDLLAEAVREARRPSTMPAALKARLRAVVPDPEGRRDMPLPPAAADLPWWIADSRWTTAACALLTAALTLTAGDASARFVELRDVPAKARVAPWLSVEHLQKVGTDWLDARLKDWSKARDAMRSGAENVLDDTSDKVRQRLPQTDVGAELDALQETAADSWQGLKDDWTTRWNASAETLRRLDAGLRADGNDEDTPTLVRRAEQSFNDLAQWARTAFEPADEPEEKPKERKTP